MSPPPQRSSKCYPAVQARRRARRKSHAANPSNIPAKAPDLFGYRKYWAHRLTPAPFLPMSREEMDALGWDSCDVILVTGDAYVDHPSFGMAIVGRVLEAQGFRVGIIAQPDWRSTRRLRRSSARPNLFFGITAGNMDSMVNRYTADRAHPQRRRVHARRRRRPAARPLRDRLRAARARGVHRRADRHRRHRGEPAAHRALRLLVGESAPLDPARRAGRPARVRQRRAADRRDRASPRGRRAADRRDPATCAARRSLRRGTPDGLDRDRLDAPSTRPGRVDPPIRSVRDGDRDRAAAAARRPTPGQPHVAQLVTFCRKVPNGRPRAQRASACRASSRWRDDPVLYAHASRILHLESNPGNARALVQRHGDSDVWLNPPPLPLTTQEMDAIYELPYRARAASVLRHRRRSPPTR